MLTKTTLPHNLCTSYVTAKDNYKIDALQLTSSTAEPTAHASGFPPNVLKCRDCPMHLAISAERENNGSSVCVSCYALQKHATLKYKEYTARSHGTIASMHVTVEPPTRYSVAGHFAGRVPA